MSDTDLAILVARMEERYASIQESLQEAKEQRKEQTRKIDDLTNTIKDLDNRVKTAEAQLAESAPTIREFISIKQKVQGAGLLGKWLWIGGGVVIGWVFHARSEIVSWLTRSGN